MDSSTSSENLASSIPTSAHADSSKPNSPSKSDRDFLNPYYIHSNENPSLVLVSPVLEGSNYNCWVQAMTMALEMKNKFVFVDGSIRKPSQTDPSFPLWKRCNVLVLSWINHSISTEISSSILWITEAYNVWKELKNRFSQGDHVRISQIHHDLFSLQQSDMSVSSYFTKMRVLWDELCNFRPIPSCASESGCCCDTTKAVLQYRENDCVICFLQGLNDSYDAVKSHILLMEPLPPLSKVYSMIVQQERQLHNGNGILPSPTALAVQTPSGSSQGRGTGRGKPYQQKPNSGRFCTFCNRTNHTIDTCYQKHGYPPGYKSKKSVNHVQSDQFSDDASATPLLSLTQAQIQGLLALLPSTLPTATANSTNLVSAHHIASSSQGPSYFEDDWQC